MNVPTERKVTTLELFFDLVFVFAITQVTAYLADDHSIRGFAEGLILLALLWWAWTGYTWLGTSVDVTQPQVRVTIFSAMAALLVVALGLPEWFHEAPDGLAGVFDASLVVALAYVAVRVAHLALFAVVGKGSPGMRAAVGRLSIGVGISAVLVVSAAVLGGTIQLILVALAVLLDYAAPLPGRGEGWVVSPGHFAERHGLIVIIALGESIVAIGVGAAGLSLSWPIALVAVLGMAVSARLWVSYFDSFAEAAEHALRGLHGSAQARAARDSYSYAHMPIVAGIVLIALALKSAIGDTAENGVNAALPFYAGTSLAVGIALFLLMQVVISRRMRLVVPRALLVGLLLTVGIWAAAVWFSALAAVIIAWLVLWISSRSPVNAPGAAT